MRPHDSTPGLDVRSTSHQFCSRSTGYRPDSSSSSWRVDGSGPLLVVVPSPICCMIHVFRIRGRPGSLRQFIYLSQLSLQWHASRRLILFKLAVLVHKCLSAGRVPHYLADDCCWIRHRRPGLRSSLEMMKLEVQSVRSMLGDQSFAVDGPRVWNNLPASISDPPLSISIGFFLIDSRLIVRSTAAASYYIP